MIKTLADCLAAPMCTLFRNVMEKANKRLFIIKQLACMNTQTSTITLAYTAFFVCSALYMDTTSHLI